MTILLGNGTCLFPSKQECGAGQHLLPVCGGSLFSQGLPVLRLEALLTQAWQPLPDHALQITLRAHAARPLLALRWWPRPYSGHPAGASLQR